MLHLFRFILLKFQRKKKVQVKHTTIYILISNSKGIIVCYHKNDIFDQWKHLPVTKRGQDYEDLKQRIGEAMIEKHLY